MSLKKSLIPILLTSALFLAGCNEEPLADTKIESSQSETSSVVKVSYLYENEDYQLAISENMDWQLESEKETDNLNVVLNDDTLTALVSSVSASNTFEDIKKELIKGAGNVTVLSESDDFLSYKSKLKNAVRTDVYFKEQDELKNYIITFMSQTSEFEDNQPKVESLLNNIHFNEKE
ncbi:hypothetical protein AB4027_05290 [Alkalibacterium putridalgicola]|uniref:hypothetical protein n=1 Tax=Alkalibacterium putridalgicola TaxID=426703 RepID=UPI0034CF1EB4